MITTLDTYIKTEPEAKTETIPVTGTADFFTEDEICHAVQLVKQMETERQIKFTKKEFDYMTMVLLNPLIAVEM